MPQSLLIRGGRVIDPASRLDARVDILVENGRITQIGDGLKAKAAEVLDATGCVVTPGFIDTPYLPPTWASASRDWFTSPLRPPHSPGWRSPKSVSDWTTRSRCS